MPTVSVAIQKINKTNVTKIIVPDFIQKQEGIFENDTACTLVIVNLLLPTAVGATKLRTAYR